jgi:hypothetical protein
MRANVCRPSRLAAAVAAGLLVAASGCSRPGRRSPRARRPPHRWLRPARRGSPPGSAAVWSNATAHDDRVVRIDPATLAVTQTFHLGGNVSAVAFGFGSLWATVQPGLVVRLTRHRAVD